MEAGLLGLVLDGGGADIDDRRTRLDPAALDLEIMSKGAVKEELGSHHGGLACRSHNNVSLANHVREVLRLAMRNRNRRRALREKDGHGETWAASEMGSGKRKMSCCNAPTTLERPTTTAFLPSI